MSNRFEGIDLREVDLKTIEEEFFMPEELAERWITSTGYLANRRSQGKGPEYLKLGSKVLYPVEAIALYEAEHKRPGGTEPEGDEETALRDGSQ